MNQNDQFFVLADFDAYCKACEAADAFYEDKKAWARACLINIGSSGKFISVVVASLSTVESSVRSRSRMTASRSSSVSLLLSGILSENRQQRNMT